MAYINAKTLPSPKRPYVFPYPKGRAAKGATKIEIWLDMADIEAVTWQRDKSPQ
jgi:hypothetical protein